MGEGAPTVGLEAAVGASGECGGAYQVSCGTAKGVYLRHRRCEHRSRRSPFPGGNSQKAVVFAYGLQIGDVVGETHDSTRCFADNRSVWTEGRHRRESVVQFLD